MQAANGGGLAKNPKPNSIFGQPKPLTLRNLTTYGFTHLVCGDFGP